RPDLRHRRHRCRPQGDHHERDRLRHAGAVRARPRRGHHPASGGRHQVRRAMGYRIKLLGITKRAAQGI
ncbi:Uncharacterized protein APZ42_006007, partial [Daphnia magna]